VPRAVAGFNREAGKPFKGVAIVMHMHHRNNLIPLTLALLIGGWLTAAGAAQ
jgi:hypothetical protein